MKEALLKFSREDCLALAEDEYPVLKQKYAEMREHRDAVAAHLIKVNEDLELAKTALSMLESIILRGNKEGQ